MTWANGKAKYMPYVGRFPSNLTATLDVVDRLVETAHIIGMRPAIRQADQLGLSQWEAADLLVRNYTYAPTRTTHDRSWPARK